MVSEDVLPASSTTKRKTFRVHEVPSEWDKARLSSWLRTVQGIGLPDLQVRSLAPEHHGRHQTATVDAFNGAALPQSIEGRPDAADAAKRERIELQTDTDFNGMTTLFMPPKDDHLVDIIVVCGLGGHPIGSFRNKNDFNIWIRDTLPYHLTAEHTNRPMARLMTYGYESHVADSRDSQHLGDLASAFREALSLLRGGKPLIFVAHSLGGLIVKQAIISLHQSTKEDHRQLLQNIYGIVFFAVPHAGMDISSLIPMVGGGHNLNLVANLSHISSQVLDVQRQEFQSALGKEGQTEVFCFYETLESPTAKEVRRNDPAPSIFGILKAEVTQVEKDKWRMEGPTTVLVTKTSATHCRPWEGGDEHVCPIRATHSDIVKFARNDPGYDLALQKLTGLCHRALRVRHRWDGMGAKFLVPYQPNPDFVGRQATLDQIKGIFRFDRPPSSHAAKRLSLYGLGGIGKTQIAIHLAYWIRKTHPDISVLWVHASNIDRFQQSYKAIAQAYEISGCDDPEVDTLVLVYKFLSQKYHKQWVMIIDNADDKELIFSAGIGSAEGSNNSGLKRYIPECENGRVLLTTRDMKVGRRFMFDGEPITINATSNDETFEIIQRKMKPMEVNKEQATQLAERLDCVPLALVQGLAFMHENDMMIDEYIQCLDEGDTVLLDQLNQPFEAVGRDTETPNSVTETWMVSFEMLRKRDPQRKEYASDLLAFMSLFDRQDIPKDFLDKYYDGRSKTGLSTLSKASSLGTLAAYSFVAKNGDGTYNMHRLVQLVTRKWLANCNRLQEFVSQAVSVFSHLCPSVRWETLDTFMKMAAHAKAVVGHTSDGSTHLHAERAKILLKMGFYFGGWKSQFAEAEKCAKEAYQMSKDALGAGCEEAREAVWLLLVVYEKQGRWNEMKRIGQTEVEPKFGRDDDINLKISQILARVYRQEKELSKAENLLVHVVETRRRKWGNERYETLRSMHDLALLYLDQGRLTESCNLLLEVCDTRGRLYGEEHPATLNALHTLASIHHRRKDYKQAAELDKKIWDLRKKTLGDDHHSTLSSMKNYAVDLFTLGQRGEAVELIRDCSDSMERVLGAQHPHFVSSRKWLQSMERKMSRTGSSGVGGG